MENKRLYFWADQLSVTTFELIKLAKQLNISHSPSPQEIRLLQEKISGFYDLTDNEIRSIEDFLHSENAQDFLQEATPLLTYLDSDEQSRYLQYIAEQLFEQVDNEELKGKIKPATLYQSIMNLGVIELHRPSASTKEKKPLPIHLLRFNTDIAEQVIKRYLLRTFESRPISSAEDFRNIRRDLKRNYKLLLDYAKR